MFFLMHDNQFSQGAVKQIDSPSNVHQSLITILLLTKTVLKRNLQVTEYKKKTRNQNKSSKTELKRKGRKEGVKTG